MTAAIDTILEDERWSGLDRIGGAGVQCDAAASRA